MEPSMNDAYRQLLVEHRNLQRDYDRLAAEHELCLTAAPPKPPPKATAKVPTVVPEEDD